MLIAPHPSMPSVWSYYAMMFIAVVLFAAPVLFLIRAVIRWLNRH